MDFCNRIYFYTAKVQGETIGDQVRENNRYITTFHTCIFCIVTFASYDRSICAVRHHRRADNEAVSFNAYIIANSMFKRFLSCSNSMLLFTVGRLVSLSHYKMTLKQGSINWFNSKKSLATRRCQCFTLVTTTSAAGQRE